MPAKASNQGSSAIHVVYGAEMLLKREVIAAIIDRVLGSADRALALTEYDGGNAELAQVLDDLRTLPFLTERRLVVVCDADTFITRYRQDLEDYAEGPSPTGVLLLECKTFPSTTRLYKRVQAVGQVDKCEAVAARSIPSWLIQRGSNAHGVRLDMRSATMLRDFVGDDLGILDSELQKLSLYAGQRATITAADVQALVGHTREEKVWGIFSAIAVGDEAKAIVLWEQVWETDRAAPGRAIAGVAYKVRQLLGAKRAQEAGASAGEVARLAGAWGDEQRARAELAAFTTEQYEMMLCRLLDADVAAKTGQASVQSSIESFIVEMCRARTTKRRATG